MIAQDRHAAPARIGERVETDRLDLWQEAIKAHFNLAVSADKTEPFFGRLETRRFGHSHIDRIFIDGAHYHLNWLNQKKSEATLLLIQIETGALHVSQRGRNLQIAGTDGVILLGNEPFTIDVIERGTRFMVLRVPISGIAARVTDLSMTLSRRLIMTHPAGILLTAYLAHLLQQDDLPNDTSFAVLVTNHLSDLLAVLLPKEASQVKNGHQSRYYLLRNIHKQAIKSCIANDICDPLLRPDDVARRVGISGRYLHKLLQEEGVMFSELLRHQRLQQAYRLLMHPDHADSSVAQIAGDAGFTDYSYFRRRFKQYFNATPYDIHARSQQRLRKMLML